MSKHWQKRVGGLVAPILAVALSGCSVGAMVGAPTPEPWSPPPTATAAVAPTATAAPVASQAERRTVAVQIGAMPDRLELGGQVAPVLERELAFRQDGILRTLYTEPNAPVTKGQLLAELDLGTLQDQLREAKVVAEQDARALAQALQQSSLDVQTAELALEEARDRLASLKTPPAAAEIAQARAAVQAAEAALARVRNDASAVKSKAERALADAVKELERLQAAYGEAAARLERRPTEELRAQVVELEPLLRAAETQVALAQIDVDTARGNEIAAVSAAEADLALARASLDTLVAGPDRFEVAAAERAVRLAGVELERARQAGAPDPSLAKSVAASELAVKEIESQIEARRIYAPFDGAVTAVDALAGFPIQAELPIVRMMDRSGLQVTVPGISDSDLARLTPGTQVRISFSRYPDRTLSGTVRSPAPGFSSVSGPVLHVAYNAPDFDLAIGEPAVVLADFGEREGVRWLPREAVRREGGAHVMVVDGEGERRVDVEVGAIADGRVEIVSGLDQGDQVVLP